MLEAVVREAVDGFMASALYHGHHGVREPVRAAKIIFFGFFRTEADALDAVK